MEREKFEKEFGEAFKGAEQSPSESVWVNIELELERAEGKNMKRRVLFYQMLAAASITFALILTGAGLLFIRNTESGNTNLASNAPAIRQDQSAAAPSPNTMRAEDQELSHSSEPELVPNDDRGETQTNARRKTQGGPSMAESLADADKPEIDKAPRGAKQSNRGNPINLESRPEDGKTIDGNSHLLTAEADDVFNDVMETNGRGRDGLPKNQVTTQENNVQSDSRLEAAVADSHDGNMAAPETEQLALQNSGEENTNDGLGLENSASESREVIAAGADAQKQNGVEEEISEPDPVALMFARLNDLEKELAEQGANGKKKKEAGGEKVWTSVGFAAGGYNGQGSAPVQLNAFALNSAVENQAQASGVAYSVNISMGTRITNRFVLQGGVSYLNNNTSYISNQVVRAENMDFKPATISDLRAAGASLFNNSTVIPTAPHSVNNNMEFISIPVQAGYVIIDRKFGLQFNAGVATDFFLQNTIDPQGSGVKSTTQDRGSESPYRSTNFSGLMGTEFTYRLGERYRLALNPGLRYPLNSIYKDETGIDSTPLTFDVGLRFRYIFR